MIGCSGDKTILLFSIQSLLVSILITCSEFVTWEEKKKRGGGVLLFLAEMWIFFVLFLFGKNDCIVVPRHFAI